ncbi:hypothetical protein DXG01_011124 [Tephrocybe rancida]|nr:hypothetical protein DXG01_011124 [Tephrocybe rancida]
MPLSRSTKTFSRATSPIRDYKLAYDNHKALQFHRVVKLAQANRDSARAENELAAQCVKEAQFLLDILREDEIRSTAKLKEANTQVKAAIHFAMASRDLSKEPSRDISGSSEGVGDDEENDEMDEYFYSMAFEPSHPLTENALQALSTVLPSAGSSSKSSNM